MCKYRCWARWRSCMAWTSFTRTSSPKTSSSSRTAGGSGFYSFCRCRQSGLRCFQVAGILRTIPRQRVALLARQQLQMEEFPCSVACAGAALVRNLQQPQHSAMARKTLRACVRASPSCYSCGCCRCEVKVIDLGSSCFTSDVLSSYVQSRAYRAPEVILGLPYGQVRRGDHNTHQQHSTKKHRSGCACPARMLLKLQLCRAAGSRLAAASGLQDDSLPCGNTPCGRWDALVDTS